MIVAETPLPRSPSTERNGPPIAEALRGLLDADDTVLEIGSGTGRHAAFFSQSVPFARWQTSDLRDRLEGIRAWRRAADDPRLPPPIELDVLGSDWPLHENYSAVFSVNTCHIMPWIAVESMVHNAADILTSDGKLIVYGPFSENGLHTSRGNELFDERLRCENPKMGIRDMSDVEKHAQASGLRCFARFAMPANNFLLVWNKREPGHD